MRRGSWPPGPAMVISSTWVTATGVPSVDILAFMKTLRTGGVTEQPAASRITIKKLMVIYRAQRLYTALLAGTNQKKWTPRTFNAQHRMLNERQSRFFHWKFNVGRSMLNVHRFIAALQPPISPCVLCLEVSPCCMFSGNPDKTK